MTLELSQSSLAWLFLASFVMGYIAGVVYDLFKLRRKLLNFGKIAEIVVLSIEDITFFVCWSVAFCILLYAMTFGVVRIEAILLQLLGFVSYRKTLAIPIGKISDRVAGPIKKSLHDLKKNKKKKIKKRRERKDRQKNERTR